MEKKTRFPLICILIENVNPFEIYPAWSHHFSLNHKLLSMYTVQSFIVAVSLCFDSCQNICSLCLLTSLYCHKKQSNARRRRKKKHTQTIENKLSCDILDIISLRFEIISFLFLCGFAIGYCRINILGSLDSQLRKSVKRIWNFFFSIWATRDLV